MPELVLRFAGNLAALWVASEIFDEMTYGDSFWVLVLAAAVFTFVNWIVKPIVAILAIPLIILTLGVAYFFVNVLMLLVTDWVVPDFEVGGFWTLVGATIIIWLVNVIIGAFFRDVGRSTDAAAGRAASTESSPSSRSRLALRRPVTRIDRDQVGGQRLEVRLGGVDQAREAVVGRFGQVAGAAGPDRAAVDDGHARELLEARRVGVAGDEHERAVGRVVLQDRQRRLDQRGLVHHHDVDVADQRRQPGGERVLLGGGGGRLVAVAEVLRGAALERVAVAGDPEAAVDVDDHVAV